MASSTPSPAVGAGGAEEDILSSAAGGDGGGGGAGDGDWAVALVLGVFVGIFVLGELVVVFPFLGFSSFYS